MTTDLLEEIITKEEGRGFVESCGDTNTIHTEGDIIQGLHLASFVMKSFYLQHPEYRNFKLNHLEIKFKKRALYNEHLFFMSNKPEPAENNRVKVIGSGIKKDIGEFIGVEMIYSQNLEVRNPTAEITDFTYEKIITPADVEKLCRSAHIDYDLFKVAYLREYFVSTFVAGALCGMITPKEIPEGKMIMFAKQEFDFYDFPNYDFERVSIKLKRLKDNARAIEVSEECNIDNYKIIKGSSLLLKVPRTTV